MISWLRPVPQPYFVPLWVSQYRSLDLPVAQWAEADAEAIIQYYPNSPDTYASQEAALLLRELRALDELSTNTPTVVYVSGFVLLDEGQGVNLLPADANVALGTNTIAISEVLRIVNDARPSRKLLVLDLHEPTHQPYTASVRTDAYERVVNLVGKLENSSTLSVLLSCSPGQRTRIMQTTGRSLFGYYFERGLAGEALLYHNPDHPRNRRISVHELARYLQVKVDNWAQANLGERQTPLLLGNGPDFDMIATGKSVETEDASQLARPDPPDWLTESWQELDQWFFDGTISDSPRLYQQLFSATVRAESAWLPLPAERVRDDLAFSRGRIETAKQNIILSYPKPPQPASLGFAEQLGYQGDAKFSKTLEDYFQQLRQLPSGQPQAREAAAEKLTTDFLKSAQDQTWYTFESSLYDLAASKSNGYQDWLALIDELLSQRQQPLQSSEGRFLSRLAALAKSTPTQYWSPELARLALQTVRDVERAVADPMLYQWAAPLMDECFRLRVEADQLFDYWADIPTAAISSRFQRASVVANSLLEFSQSLAEGRKLCDQSFVIANVTAEVPSLLPDREPAWQKRLEQTLRLDKMLVVPNEPISEQAILALGDELRRMINEIKQSFSQMIGGTPDQLVNTFIQQLHATVVDPTILHRISLLQCYPGLSSAQRKDLNTAFGKYVSELDAKVRTQDKLDYDKGIVFQQSPFTPSEQAAARQTHYRMALTYSRCHIALLRAAGLLEADLNRLQADLDKAESAEFDDPVWDRLSIGIRRAWYVELPIQAKGFNNPQLDRLAAIYPGLDYVSQLDDPTGGIRPILIQKYREQHLEWLAGWYQFLANSGWNRGEFEYYLANVSATPQVNISDQLRTDTTIPAVTLSPTTPTANTQFSVVHAKGSPELQIELILPSSGSFRGRVTTEQVDSNSPQSATTQVNVELQLNGLVPTGDQRPNGFVVVISQGNRSLIRHIPLAKLPDPPGQSLLVTLPTSSDVDVGDSLRLRPSQAAQTVAVSVRNTESADAPVEVQAAGPFPRVTGRVTAKANGISAVPFASVTPPAPMGQAASSANQSTPPPTESLPATVNLQLLGSAKDATSLEERGLTVRLAEPNEYVEIVSATFQPVSLPQRPQNQLQVVVRARRQLGPTPCVVELVLDPKEIPGLGAIKQAQLRGVVPPDGKPLTLQATGITLDPAADPRGSVSLTVDGVADAFRLNVAFMRYGDPTQPSLDMRPRLRLNRLDPPQPGSSVRFSVGADRAPAGSTLHVRLVRPDDQSQSSVEREQTLPSLRKAQATFAATADGISVTPTLQDWELTWSNPQLIGKRLLQARLLDTNGQVLLTQEEAVFYDTTPPTNVAFDNLPEQALVSKPLAVTVAAADPETGVLRVQVVAGEYQDGKPGPKAQVIDAAPATDQPGRWTVTVKPGDNPGPLPLTAVVTNLSGLVTTQSAEVNLVAELPAAPGSVRGVVLEGTRVQPGLTVTLSKAQPKGPQAPSPSTDAQDDKQAQTGTDGSFRFTGLEPGKYNLSVTKTATGRSAKAEVTVTPGSDVKVELKLSL